MHSALHGSDQPWQAMGVMFIFAGLIRASGTALYFCYTCAEDSNPVVAKMQQRCLRYLRSHSKCNVLSLIRKHTSQSPKLIVMQPPSAQQ